MRRPGIEPGPSAWKADILTTRPMTHEKAFRSIAFSFLCARLAGKESNDSSGVRTHALSDQRLKLAP